MQLTKQLLLLCTLFCYTLWMHGQEEEDKIYYDDVYSDLIKTIKFHPAGLPLSYPVVELGGSTFLELSFDAMEEDSRDFVYTIQHCDKGWKPSLLSELEYIEGFSEGDIYNYDYSFNTRTVFTNYSLLLPNDDIRWTKSGNYVLKVYDEDAEELVFTRRFMVVESIYKIDAQMARTAMVDKSTTHQEIDFKVTHEGIPIRSPLQEVQAVVLQNGRWDNASPFLYPKFARHEELLFDYQNRIVFSAGKEYRFLDIRTLEGRAEKVVNISKYADRYEVALEKEFPRVASSYFFAKDINGNFVIESLDRRNFALESDYAYVLFVLTTPTPVHNGEVYIVGNMTDWKPREEFRMVYNPAISAYVAKPLLKQGYYNYKYAVVHKDTSDVIDLEELEGNWYQTENEYLILVYQRPFGERYDRLVAAKTIGSNE